MASRIMHSHSPAYDQCPQNSHSYQNQHQYQYQDQQPPYNHRPSSTPPSFYRNSSNSPTDRMRCWPEDPQERAARSSPGPQHKHTSSHHSSYPTSYSIKSASLSYGSPRSISVGRLPHSPQPEQYSPSQQVPYSRQSEQDEGYHEPHYSQESRSHSKTFKSPSPTTPMSPPSSVSYSPSSPPSLPSPTSKSMVYASKASSVYSPITTTVLSEEKMFSQCLSPDAQVPFSPNFSQPQSRSPSPATVSKGDRTLYVDISAAASSLSLLSTSSTPSWSWSSSTPTMASPNDHKTDMAMSEGLVPRSTRERKSSESSSLRLPARYNNVSGLKLRLPCGTHGCKLQFCTEQTLKAHERICRPNVTPPVFICEESDCKASYTSVEKFSRHLVTHMPEISPEEASKFPCIRPDCSKFLSTPKSLKDHLQIHRERDSNVKLPCPNKGCNKLFGTSRCLRTHELRCRQVQSGVRLPCPFEGCKSTFGSTDYVRRHVLDHEKGLVGKDFQCNYAFCKSILANPLTLQRHVQLHEEQSIGIEWRCLFVGCGKLYSGSKQLKDHQTRIHKDLDENHTFGCAYSTCKGRFKCQGSAYKHDCLYRKQCGFEGCKILIPNKKILEEHLWHHKTLMSNPPYPCFEEDCRKKFYSKTGILAHLVSHMVDANITARTTSETLTTEGSVDETKEMTTSATAATPTTTPSKTDTNNTTASGA